MPPRSLYGDDDEPLGSTFAERLEDGIIRFPWIFLTMLEMQIKLMYETYYGWLVLAGVCADVIIWRFQYWERSPLVHIPIYYFGLLAAYCSVRIVIVEVGLFLFRVYRFILALDWSVRFEKRKADWSGAK